MNALTHNILDLILKWLYENSAAIIISSLLSLVISKVFYDKSNRTGLVINVISPIVLYLEKGYNKENYQKISEIKSSYFTKYLNKREQKALIALIHQYEEVCKYSKNYVDAESIVSYFLKKLKENGVNTKPCPIYDDDGNEVASDYPPDFYFLKHDVEAITSDDLFDFNPNDFQTQLNNVLTNYAQKIYNIKKNIIYFDNINVEQIINNSNESKKWEEEFEIMKKKKARFFEFITL